jgi:hypothetical protein
MDDDEEEEEVLMDGEDGTTEHKSSGDRDRAPPRKRGRST